jgi:hypothetical protein
MFRVAHALSVFFHTLSTKLEGRQAGSLRVALNDEVGCQQGKETDQEEINHEKRCRTKSPGTIGITPPNPSRYPLKPNIQDTGH